MKCYYLILNLHCNNTKNLLKKIVFNNVMQCTVYLAVCI